MDDVLVNVLNQRVAEVGASTNPLNISSHPLTNAIRDGDEKKAFAMVQCERAVVMCPSEESDDPELRTRTRFQNDVVDDPLFNWCNDEPIECWMSVLVEGMLLPDVIAIGRKQGSHIESMHLIARDSEDGDYAVLKRVRWAGEDVWVGDDVPEFPDMEFINVESFGPARRLCWQKATELVQQQQSQRV